MQQGSARSGGLDHSVSVFITEDYETELDDQNRFIIEEMGKQPHQRDLPGFSHEYIRRVYGSKNLYAANTSLFRSPQDLVILSHEPEREFLFRLIEHSKWITAWIKSPDMGFYSLDYEYWKKGKDRVRRSFNPDFFIKISIKDYLLMNLHADSGAVSLLRHLQERGIDDIILVVEIKDNDDASEATAAKERFGREHFKNLNKRLRKANPIDFPAPFRNALNQQYIFFLLRPAEYATWFSRLNSGLFIYQLEAMMD